MIPAACKGPGGFRLNSAKTLYEGNCYCPFDPTVTLPAYNSWNKDAFCRPTSYSCFAEYGNFLRLRNNGPCGLPAGNWFQRCQLGRKFKRGDVEYIKIRCATTNQKLCWQNQRCTTKMPQNLRDNYIEKSKFYQFGASWNVTPYGKIYNK
jgi:hypothetical protein